MSEETKEVGSQLYNEDPAPENKDAPIVDEQKADETKPVIEKPNADTEKEVAHEKPVVPEKYELKLPDDSKLSAKELDGIAAYAKERGLSNEQAQEIVNVKNEAVSSFIKAESDRLQDMSSKEWVEQTKADKEIGGDDFNKNIEMAKRVVTKFADQKLIDELDATGFGNHPELVRMFVRVGKHMASDTLIRPGVTAGGKQSMEDIFYSKQT